MRKTEPLPAGGTAKVAPEPMPTKAAPVQSVKQGTPKSVVPLAPETVFNSRLFAKPGKEGDEYRKIVIKHIELRYLENSPARNTPEAQTIQSMLAERGVGREAVMIAYNIAYNYHQFVSKASAQSPGREDAIRHMGMQMEGARIADLTNDYGVGADFLEQLFTLKPTVFAGQKDINGPQPGDVLLTQ